MLASTDVAGILVWTIMKLVLFAVVSIVGAIVAYAVTADSASLAGVDRVLVPAAVKLQPAHVLSH